MFRTNAETKAEVWIQENLFKLPESEVLILFSCSTQLSMKYFLIINVEMPTFVGILTFMREKNSILGLSEPKKAKFPDIYTCTYVHLKFHAKLSSLTQLSILKHFTLLVCAGILRL